MTNQIETEQVRLVINDFISRFSEQPVDFDAFELMTDIAAIHMPQYTASEIMDAIRYGGEL